ncbi:Nmad3 family putative nucleotide modification protein [Methanosarcina mazei]|jgi:hypothetical protein|uniref:Nucleotide modification associated domain-containing protein n=2 Tax=Methanosarcina mazei TaxID=2209 RepID=A0A0F8H2S2_METMZ|nr:hypothetical protein [Methanosarcina mazei]AKB67660.1 hypothetical protein MSMAL_1117 [Methanosarcina mazei LYC]KKG14013.1 hypothetical protein DU34_11080 [Methanosarcina mazei]KKG32880.1 hypothetical protein DU49_01825 [Methanosarcina mazei]KKG39207.1 hypothetical protein DU39_01630 [Methanosarcina mazei]KKG45698.1 hypothetical protein DU35_18050 [Methanosarcina mazei]
MKAMLLRVGIDTGSGGTLGPIFKDGSFEYIPIPEGYLSEEDKTYGNTIGRKGLPLSTYVFKSLKDVGMHFDPEFKTYTYGDPTSKRSSLLRLQKNDLLVFYAGLKPYNQKKEEAALYIIGYFTVKEVIDFNLLSTEEREKYCKRCKNNAHIKRMEILGEEHLDDLVIIMGQKNGSKLLDKAIKISEKGSDSIGRNLHVVSKKMRPIFGFEGSIQRSRPREVKEEYVDKLKNLLFVE